MKTWLNVAEAADDATPRERYSACSRRFTHENRTASCRYPNGVPHVVTSSQRGLRQRPVVVLGRMCFLVALDM